MVVYLYGNPGGGKGSVPREKMLQEGKQHETEKNNQWGKKKKLQQLLEETRPTQKTPIHGQI